MNRFGLAMVAVLFWTACGRVVESCSETQPSGAELVRRGDVVLVGTVRAGEVEVQSVLQGRLRDFGDKGNLRVEGLPDGLAVIPLRLVEGRYRPVVACWTPVIPLAWRPAAGLGLEEILLSSPPSGGSGSITPGAAGIAAELERGR